MSHSLIDSVVIFEVLRPRKVKQKRENLPKTQDQNRADKISMSQAEVA